MTEGKKVKSGTLGIVRKIKHAFVQRAKQIQLLVDDIRNCPHPTVLCLDLNDTPLSYSYRKIAKLMNDSYLNSGKGIPNTYIGTFLHFRIDYIFHSDELKSHNFKTIKRKLSDHYPIRCDIALKEDK